VHPTIIDLPPDLLERATAKARRENLSLEEVLRKLLARWVVDNPEPPVREPSRERLVRQARASRGMWGDRDPDEFLAASRSRLRERDEDLQNARLDAR
jgi:hypothetical protein